MKELAKIQQELHAPKGQRNNFGKYNYRSCEDILEAVKPLLGECTLTLSDTIQEVGGRVYVTATAVFTNPEGKQVTVSASAREPEDKKGMDASQITGAASSYARKYALNGLFCIDDTKDADATNEHGKQAAPAKKAAKKSAPKKVEPMTEVQKTNILSMQESAGVEPERFVQGIEWASGKRTQKLDELNQEEAAKLIGMLTKIIKDNKTTTAA